MAKRKNAKNPGNRQNSSRPAQKSGRQRYPEDYRGYSEPRRTNSRPPGRTYSESRYYNEDYSRRPYGYEGSAAAGGRSYSGREYEYRRTGTSGSSYSGGYSGGYSGSYSGGYSGGSYRQRPSSARPRTAQPRRKASSSGSGNPQKRNPRNGRQNRRKAKKPVRLKKRFYFFMVLLILLVAFGGYAGIKALNNHVIPSISERFHSTVGGGDAEAEAKEKGKKGSGDKVSDYDSVPMFNLVVDDLGTPDSELKVIDSEEKKENAEGEEGKKGEEEEVVVDENTIDLAKLPMELKIRAAVLNSWYISPLGQTRATIEESFGVLNKYEDWAGGIYYHKGFPDSMYVTYKGKNGSDGMPNEDAHCTGVSVALKQIIEFEPFSPGEKWGPMHEDDGTYGWTDYFYSIEIQRGVNLIVYCEDDGSVNQETHIIVRKV